MISREDACRLFIYDEDRGVLINRTQRNYLAKAGAVVGSVKSNGYVQLSAMGRKYHAHKIIWLIKNGKWPSTIDHINGDRSDNRIENLREVTKQQNAWNSRAHSDSKSGLKGASFHKASGRWHSRICMSGKTRSLGYFSSALEAHEAYASAAATLFGSFARTQ